jgi:hypothetical protein
MEEPRKEGMYKRADGPQVFPANEQEPYETSTRDVLYRGHPFAVSETDDGHA